MQPKQLTYYISELPDARYVPYQSAAGGDVQNVIWRDCERLARAITNYPPHSLAVTIKFCFDPLPITGGNVQERLRLFLIGEARKPEILESLRLLIEQGPLARFYTLNCHDKFILERSDLTQVVEAVRRTSYLTPLHGSEFNDRIPNAYYIIDAFKAANDNDFLSLDSVLNRIQEPVTLALRIEPTDVTAELAAHTGYLARLQAINRTWDSDDDPDDLTSIFLREESNGSSPPPPTEWVKPLRLEDPLASEVLRRQQRFHESLTTPHVQFSFKVLAPSKPTAQLVASVFAEAAFEKSTYRLIDSTDNKPARVIPAEYSQFNRLANLATVDEILGAFRLPMASSGSPLCIRKNTDPPVQREEDMVVLGHDPALAAAGFGSRKCAPRGPNLNNLVKHVFISGVTGCGKTTAAIILLISLYSHGIPFIIMEPAKTQWRLIKTLRDSSDPIAKSLANDLEVFTPGNDCISPFRFNPLQICAGISQDEHIGNLMNCFMGALPMLPALPSLLQETLELVYEEREGLDGPPSMADLAATAQRVLQGKRYSGDTSSDFRAALEVRLGSLLRGSIGRVFQSRYGAPTIEHLMRHPCLVEMDYLAPDSSALLTMFLLMAIREHLIATPNPNKGPRLAIVLEEAHLLAGNTGPARASEEVADPKAFAAEAICRLLVELRALGVVVIILDQHPSAVAPEVVKSTATKLAFRQVHAQDREELGAAMLFGPVEAEEIARLRTGQAYFYTEGLYGPCLIETIDPSPLFDLNKLVSREEILPYITGDDWFKEVSLERAATELFQLKEAMDAYDEERLQLLEKAATLLDARVAVLSRQATNSMATLATIGQEASVLKVAMDDLYYSLRNGPLRRFLLQANRVACQDQAVEFFRQSLMDRFATVCEPGYAEAKRKLDELITSCPRG